jgi:hypothetical protein
MADGLGSKEMRDRPAKRKRKSRVNELQALIESGRLPVGTHLTHRGRKIGLDRIATVVREGVRIGDRTYASLSSAARAIAKHSVNGWVFWEFESGEKIDRLRKG